MAVIMTRIVNKLEPALKKKAFSFLEKLMTDPTAPGLHIEPIVNSADSRVRTGRVDQGARAVLFKLTSGEGTDWLIHGFFAHDEANHIAERIRLGVDPRTGVTRIVEDEAPRTAPQPAPTAAVTVEEKPAPPAGMLASYGFTADDLVGDLGLDESLAARALSAPDEDALLEVAAGADELSALMLIDLSGGRAIDEIRKQYGLVRREEHELDTDHSVLEGMRAPAGRTLFAWIESNDELKRVIDEGDFGAWRVFLHPDQRQFVDKHYAGSARISGGAGTGKTVVLLHRTAALARRGPMPHVLLTTFTKNLASMLHADLRRLDPELPLAERIGEPGAYVSGIDSLAAQIVRGAGKDIAAAAELVLGVAASEVQPDTGGEEWGDALATAGQSLPPALRSSAFMAEEYASIVLPNRITSRTAYLRVRRQGRGVALDRGARMAVWDVIEAYRAAGRAFSRVDFDEVAALAAAHLDLRAKAGDPRPFDHVLVDEGQDLSPTRWQLLRAAVGAGADDLFIAEDSHQRIYGHRVTLSHYGIGIVGRSRRLQLNYRTTAQVLRWAMSVLDGGDYVDIDGNQEDRTGYRSARTGPRPEVVQARDQNEEYDLAAAKIKEWLAEDGVAPETFAVLVRDRWQQSRVVDALAERGVTLRPVGADAVKAGQPVVMTMHRAKGTEFSKVLLFGIREGAIPAIPKDQKYDESAVTDAELRERSLLYVASTRARDVLVVTYSNELSHLVAH